MVQMNLTVPLSTERSSPVMLSAAKHLAADRDTPFASLRVTWCDWSNCQGLFFTIEPCLNIFSSSWWPVKGDFAEHPCPMLQELPTLCALRTLETTLSKESGPF